MSIDAGNKIDWGKTSEDYSAFRGGMPESFFEKLLVHGVGKKQQRVLDLGTGTGNLARAFAKNGALVSGVDVSEGQISEAQKLMREQDLEIDFRVSNANSLPFEDDSFDCATANQCFLYFDTQKTIKELKRVLTSKGLFMLSHFSWLPRIDSIARESENLVLKYNPVWGGADFDGVPAPYYQLTKLGLYHRAMYFYDVEIPFTKASWRGRIRASRGIGASLSPEAVASFDKEHEQLLDRMTEDSFSILHRIDVNIFSFMDYENAHTLY